ncbi:MAG: DUF1116 domain-containing protein [Solirubrobacterales bacterium]
MKTAGEALPGMEPNIVLTSGAPMPWEEYFGGQRAAVIGGAIFEGLADDEADADAKLTAGEIIVDGCHDYGCVGSLAGIYTASMPVLEVTNTASGNAGYCNFFEGPSPKRLNYGTYDDEVRETLLYVQEVIAPTVAEAVERSEGGIELGPIIRRALGMGDELHSRNAAGTLLFGREIVPHLFDIYSEAPERVRETYAFMSDSPYFFLRLSMAAAKATADASRDVEGSSLVSAMTFSCRKFSIRAGGLGDEWFSAELEAPSVKLFEGFTDDDIEFMGGESVIAETTGLGGFAQAAAFTLQDYQGGTPQRMAELNEAMYSITEGEHPDYKIPYFAFRGVPLGIDIFKVRDTGIQPVMDIGIAGRSGEQIGAGILRAPLDCFEQAATAYESRYGG